MLRAFLLTACVGVLAGCQILQPFNFTDNSIQDLTIETPGAHNAICYAYVDGFKYKYYPPQTRSVPKSSDPVKVDCMAPGNRDRTVIVEPKINNATVANTTFGSIPEELSEATAHSFYSYPTRIEVSFEHSQPKPFPLPQHNAPDIKQPEEYLLEEFLPSTPRLNSDIGQSTSTTIRRRQAPGAAFFEEDPMDAIEGFGTPESDVAPNPDMQDPRPDSLAPIGKADTIMNETSIRDTGAVERLVSPASDADGASGLTSRVDAISEALNPSQNSSASSANSDAQETVLEPPL